MAGRAQGSAVDDALSPAQRLRRAVAEVFEVDETALIGRSRVRPITRARHAACYVLRRRLDLSYPTIGRLLGGIDHSSVIFGERATADRMLSDPELAGRIVALVYGKIHAQAHDAHVRQWHAWRRARASILTAAAARAPDLGEELAEFMAPDKVWCSQCDASVSLGVAATCKRRFCGIASARRAA